MTNRYPQRGGQRGSKGSSGPIDMREEDFARSAAEQPELSTACSDCHDEPLIKVISISGDRRYENDFYGDPVNRTNPLGDNCAKRKTFGIITAEADRIEHVISVLKEDLPDYDASRIETAAGDRLAEIEEDYIPEIRYGDAINAVRGLRRVTNLRCAEAFIVEAKRIAQPFKASQEGSSLLDRLNALEKERVGMMPNSNGWFPKPEDGGARADRDEFAVFRDAQRLRVQAVNVATSEERREQILKRRDEVASEVRGTFSSRFRRSSPAVADETNAQPDPATLGDAVDPATKAVLESIDDDEPAKVPAVLSNDTTAETDDTASDTTADKPAAVENNA